MPETETDAADIVPLTERDKKLAFLQEFETTLQKTKAAKKAGVRLTQVNKWIIEDELFAEALTDIELWREEDLFDQLSDVADRYPNPYVARLKSETIRWQLSKINPERFGERLEVRNKHTLDISERYERALERLHGPLTPSIEMTADAGDYVVTNAHDQPKQPGNAAFVTDSQSVTKPDAADTPADRENESEPSPDSAQEDPGG